MTNNDPLIGKIFRGEYVIESELGVGGMGAVYKASQQSLNRVVAIKVMNIQLARQTGFAERFAREAQTSALLEHPNIIPIYDYGQQDGYVYLVMRLLTGHSLAERLSAQLEADHPLPNLSEVTHLIKQIASALDYAHAKGVIHRDIKPSNIMFDETGRPYLVDFGIAKLLSANSGLTGTGVAMGTPNFMPPEQWRSDPVTPATDQYALGVIVYNILTGKLPFEGDTPFALMHKHLHEYPTPPHEQRAELPEKVSPILMRALAKDPHERYATCTDFANALVLAESGYTGEPTNFFTIQLPPKTPAHGGYIPRTPSTPPVEAKNRRGAIIGIYGMISLLVFAGIIFLIGNNNSQPPATDITATATVGEVVILPSDTSAPMTPTETLSPTPQPTATETPTVDVLTAIAQIDATNTSLVPVNLTATAGAWTATPTPDLTATIDAIMSGRTATLVVTESIATNIAQKATDQFFIDQTATLAAIDRISQQAIIDQLATQVALDAIATQIALDQTATATLWTPTPTFTPTLTPTPTPTFTPTPTATLTVTPTPIAPDAILGRVSVDIGGGLNMRDIPHPEGEIFAVVPNNTVMLLTQRNVSDEWVYGSYPTTEGLMEGWVSIEFLIITDAVGNSVNFRDVLPIMPETIIDTTTPTATLIATPSPAELALAGVSSNSEWTPHERIFDNIAMMLVPTGCFMMGDENGQDDEHPTVVYCLSYPLWVDKYEVTQAQFGTFEGRKSQNDAFIGASRPVETITWVEARDFCALRGGRLPNETEWEYIARGPDGLEYPWGNRFEPNLLVYESNSGGETALVGSYPRGASWVGAEDMAGNVWEWVISLYMPYPYAEDGRNSTNNAYNDDRVLRGGSWFNEAERQGSINRNWGDSNTAYDDVGFRCVRDYQSGE